MKRDYITIYPSGFQSRTTGLIATGLLSLSSLLSAQETETDDTIFEISPFVIQEGDEEGYIASSTLAGTRLRSSLQDIGASVQVITSEFLDDIGATEANDLLLFTTGTETFGLGGNFSGGDSRQDDRVLTGAALNNPQSTKVSAGCICIWPWRQGKVRDQVDSSSYRANFCATRLRRLRIRIRTNS